LIWQGDTENASPNYSGRASFYGVGGIPHAQFGGYLTVVGGGTNMYPSYLSKYNQIININSPLVIDQTINIIDQNLVMEAEVEVTEEITTTNNKVLFILSNYQDYDYFCSVISYDEQVFNLTSIGEIDTFVNVIPIESSWDLESITAVTIVQSWSNKHILQASSSSISLDNLLLLNIEFTGITGDDDGDGIANPGETVNLHFSLINESTLLSAENLIGELSTDAPITIIEPVIQFGDSIAPGEVLDAEVQIIIDPGISLGDVEFTLTLTADYTDNLGNALQYSGEFPAIMNVSLNQAGWPLYIGNQVWSSPAIVDINSDGEYEIIFGDYSGLLHVVSLDGTEIDGFPFDLGNQIWSSPAVADIDNDGDIEIVVGSKNKHLFVLNADGTIQVDYYAAQYLMGTPALGNIDGDDELEIVFGGYSSSGKLFAINPDGTDIGGFPYQLGEKIQRGVALADFNENGKVDIVCGTDNENIYLIYDDLTVANGFPFTAGHDFRTAPSVLQLESGEKIILAGSKDNNFYAINEDGSQRFMIEANADISTTAGVVDVEGVGPVIFFGSDDGFLYAVRSTGEPVEGWPKDLGSGVVSSPCFADLDGDGEAEIVSATDAGDLFAFHLDGSEYTNFPISYEYPFSSSSTLLDIDLDGDIEIIIGTTASLVNIDVKSLGSVDGYWNMYRGNIYRNGFFISSVLGIASENIIPDNYFLNPPYPNPFNPITTIAYELSIGKKVRLSVFDLLGQEIAVLTNGFKPSGSYKTVWDASHKASGIYFCQLKVDDKVVTIHKMILIK